MLLRVRAAAPQTHFLVGEGNHADGAIRTLRQVVDHLGSTQRDRHASAIIDGAGARIPGIEMAADRHHLIGIFAPGDFTDHVVTGVLADDAAIQIQFHRHRLAIRQYTLKLVGVRVGQCGGGNGLLWMSEIAEIRHAGVRRAAIRIGTGRTQQKTGGTFGSSDGRAFLANATANAIIVAVLSSAACDSRYRRSCP